MRKVAFLPAGIDACALYRMFIPHLQIKDALFHFRIGSLELRILSGYDTIVVQRLCSQENYKALIDLKKFGMKIVYDLDDNMWALPSYNPAQLLFKKMEPGFLYCAAECDLVTVSTPALKVAAKDALSKHPRLKTPRIEVVPNSMDFSWFRPIAEEYRRKKNGRVILGWAGTNTHTGDVDKVFALLPKLLERLPQLELEFVGLPAPDCFFGDVEENGSTVRKIVHPRVRERDYVPVREWPVRWASWQWDLSIAPLADNRFNRSKSNIKMLEAASLNIPCLASPIAPYSDFCHESPLLRKYLMCATAREWEQKIEELVVDEALRLTVGKEMRRVAEQYDSKKVADKFVEVLETI